MQDISVFLWYKKWYMACKGAVRILSSISPSGFRTSFGTWTLEQTDAPWAIAEAALAHGLGNQVEKSYARSDLFDRRRELMQTWADYVYPKKV